MFALGGGRSGGRSESRRGSGRSGGERFNGSRDRSFDGRRSGSHGSRGYRGSRSGHYNGYSSPYGHGDGNPNRDFRNRYGLNQYGHLYGHHYSPWYRHHHYSHYQRIYDYGSSYYRPYYYPRYYDDYASISIGSYGYFSPYYSDLGVVYSDTVVVEPTIVEETYYTAPPGGSSVVYVRPEAVIEQQTVTVLPSQGGTVAGAGPTLPGESSNVADETAVSPAPALVKKGNEAFRAGRYDEARSWHAQAMLADAEDGYAKLFYGLANFAQGQYDVAASAFRRALMEVPELIDYPIDLRTVYDDPSILTAQLRKLARARSAQSADTELTFLLGYLYYATGDPQGAVSTLGALTSSDSDDTLARLVRDAAIRVLPGDTIKPNAKKVVPSSKT